MGKDFLSSVFIQIDDFLKIDLITIHLSFSIAISTMSQSITKPIPAVRVVRLSRKIHSKLKSFAKKDGRAIQHHVDAAVESYLDRKIVEKQITGADSHE